MDKNLPETSPTPFAKAASSWGVLLGLIILSWGLPTAWSWWQNKQRGPEAALLAKSGDIVMYSTESCVYCARAETWLNEYKVAWQACDIEKNAVCAAHFQSRGGYATPSFQVGNRWLVGFNAKDLLEALQALPTSSAQDPV